MKNNKINYTTALTHSGVFHADDVFSAALLKILNPDITISRVFKVPDIVPDDTIVFDIGFGHFDHHQKAAEIRNNGVKYAAFGLLWRKLGHLLVSKANIDKFDQSFVQAIDLADNGGDINPMTAAISSFAPNWDDPDQDMDAAFFKAVDFALDVLQRDFARLNSAERAEEEVTTALWSSDGDIVILDRFVPWQEILIPSTAKFVVFPSLRGGYNAQAIPTVHGGRDQKIPFPAEWAGAGTDVLQAIIPGMTFCHPGRFMVAATTLEAAVNACNIAINN